MNGSPTMNGSGKLARRRSSGESTGSISKIPVPSQFTPTLPRRQIPPLNRHRSLQCLRLESAGSRDTDDTDSVKSFGSGYSGCSSSSMVQCCEHAHFGRNGTTYSGRSKKYVVHCSSLQGSPEEYLTPTQRANSTIRHLRSLLSETRGELEEKEKEIARLTKEVVELRLLKAESSCAADGDDLLDNERDRNGGEADHQEVALANGHHSTPRPVQTPPMLTNGTISVTDGPNCNLPRGGGSPLAVSTSLSDSGHFEELSPHPSPRISHSALEKEIDRLKHQHEEEVKALKLSSNAQVDILVQRLAEANDRYYELKPQLEAVQAKVSKLEKEKEELLKKNKESEEKHKNMYLQMFNKGQQAAIFQQVDDSSNDGGPILTLPDLLKQLEVTKQELESVKDREFWQAENLLSGKEAVSLWNMCRKTMYRRMLENKKSKSEQDAEVTLQFLKSAVYYFLTDRENVAGHLAAIQSILGFSQDEKLSIERASYAWK